MGGKLENAHNIGGTQASFANYSLLTYSSPPLLIDDSGQSSPHPGQCSECDKSCTVHQQLSILGSEMAPQLIFGTSTLGMDMTEFQDAGSVNSLLAHLKVLGIDCLDTAARYPPLKPGRSEQLLGEANESAANFLVDTKIYTDTSTDGSGDLTREAIEKSVDASFKRLRKSEGVSRPGCIESPDHD